MAAHTTLFKFKPSRLIRFYDHIFVGVKGNLQACVAAPGDIRVTAPGDIKATDVFFVLGAFFVCFVLVYKINNGGNPPPPVLHPPPFFPLTLEISAKYVKPAMCLSFSPSFSMSLHLSQCLSIVLCLSRYRHTY